MFAILFLLIGITALFYCGSLSRKIAPHSEVKARKLTESKIPEFKD